MRAFKTNDLVEVNLWLRNRELPELTAKDVPRFGMFEPGVAVGFICLTDASACFLELFISNPKADSAKRDKAIGQISRWLLGVAVSAGFKRCLVLSSETSLVERAIDLGFKKQKITVLSKEF